MMGLGDTFPLSLFCILCFSVFFKFFSLESLCICLWKPLDLYHVHYLSLITALWVWYIQELLMWLPCSRWGTETSHQLPKVTWNQSSQHSWVHLAELPTSAPAKWTNTPSQHHCLPTWEASLPPHKMLDWVTLTHLACFFTLVQANFSNILLRKKLKTSKLKNHIHPATYLDSMNVLPYQPGWFLFFLIYLFLAVMGLFSSCSEQGLL